MIDIQERFIEACKDAINKQDGVDKKNIFVVWTVKALQNSKAVLACSENSYLYECTLNGDKEEFYFVTYNKVSNKPIPFKS